MSSNCRRNVFTLGPQTKSKTRQHTDPFEKDPFKIHSYNFRYADRPSFPMPALQQRINNYDYLRDCQTYFYNHNFPCSNNARPSRTGALQNDNRMLNLTKFQKYRRRKFLNEAGSYTKMQTNSRDKENAKTLAASLLKGSSYSCNRNLFNKLNSNNSLTNHISQNPVETDLRSSESAKQYLTPQSPGNICTVRKCSLGSGCEINIDIKSLQNNSRHENVNIKIETDSVCKNLNVPLTRTLNQHRTEDAYKVKQLNSSGTFIIDKSLSKFASHQTNKKDRIKELTSIYSCQRLNKSARGSHVKSTERSPPLIPFRSLDSRQSDNRTFSRDTFGVKKSMRKSCSHNNLNCSPYDLNYGKSKVFNTSSLLRNLNSPKQTAWDSSTQSMVSTSKRVGSISKSPLVLHTSNNARLPLNVNINVFTDKLKLLKV